MNDISYITVTMNNMDTIDPLFDSFCKYRDESLKYEYFVVDNCSSDGTPEHIEKQYPWVTLIRTEKIQGFAQNNNIAIQIASGKIIALINPDIVFLPNSIELIYNYMMSNQKVGLVGPMLLNADLSLQHSARQFLKPKTAFLRLITLGKDNVSIRSIQNYLKGYDPTLVSQSVDWVIGAAMFVRREAIEDVGLLDTNYFLYIEDQDWCFQMWKKNWKVDYFTSSKLIHNHQRSSARKLSKKTIWHIQSILYFLYKNFR